MILLQVSLDQSFLKYLDEFLVLLQAKVRKSLHDALINLDNQGENLDPLRLVLIFQETLHIIGPIEQLNHVDLFVGDEVHLGLIYYQRLLDLPFELQSGLNSLTRLINQLGSLFSGELDVK